MKSIINREFFVENMRMVLGQLFSLDKLIIADNTAKVQTLPTLKGYYEYLQVKSSLVLPLTVNNQHLGALVVHQYSHPRHWQKSEVKLLEFVPSFL